MFFKKSKGEGKQEREREREREKDVFSTRDTSYDRV